MYVKIKGILLFPQPHFFAQRYKDEITKHKDGEVNNRQSALGARGGTSDIAPEISYDYMHFRLESAESHNTYKPSSTQNHS